LLGSLGFYKEGCLVHAPFSGIFNFGF
jgi:hypothetical protein